MTPPGTLTPAQHRWIRIHLALIPVYGWLLVVWTAYAIDISPTGRLDRSGHIKGHDFAHFYVLGQIANDRAPAELYDFSAQAARMDRLVPEYENRFLPINSPQVALFLAPFASIAYERALALWILISIGVYAVSCYAIWRCLPNLRRHAWIVALFAAAFPAFCSLIAFGQTSAFALLWFTLGFLALRHDRPWLAGLALGALIYKPTLGLVLPFAFLYTREYKVVLGAIASAGLQLGAVLFYWGPDVVVGYVENFRAAIEFGPLLEAQPPLMHSLKSFFSMLLPSPSLAAASYVASALAITVLAVRTWSTRSPLELRYAVLLLATVLVDPHVYTYELVVLVPALLLLASWAVKRSEPAVHFWLALGGCYALPAFVSLTRITRLQLSVVAFAVLTVMAASAARSAGTLRAARSSR